MPCLDAPPTCIGRHEAPAGCRCAPLQTAAALRAGLLPTTPLPSHSLPQRRMALYHGVVAIYLKFSEQQEVTFDRCAGRGAARRPALRAATPSRTPKVQRAVVCRPACMASGCSLP